MAKRRVGDILNESFKNKECDKMKIKLGINREKALRFHLDELSNYCFSASH